MHVFADSYRLTSVTNKIKEVVNAQRFTADPKCLNICVLLCVSE